LFKGVSVSLVELQQYPSVLHQFSVRF